MAIDLANPTSRPYRLGRNVFCAVNCDTAFINHLDVLLPHYAGPELPDEETLKVKTGCSKDVEDLLKFMLARHRHLECAWINGALLISPAGQSVLVVGKRAGKTTISLALALGHGWRVASENYIVVDYKNGKLVPYNTPFSFQSEVIERLQSLKWEVPGPVVESIAMRSPLKWLPPGALATDCERKLGFDLAVLLDQVEENSKSAKIAITELSPHEYFHKLLPQSNLLKEGAAEPVVEALSKGQCLRISGGDISERVRVIFEGLQGARTPINVHATPALQASG